MSLVGFKAQNHPQQTAKPDVDDRSITDADFAPLHARFGFTIDAAATPTNAKLPRYWTVEDDALSQDWVGERVWCNPPYSNIRPWVEKAWAEYDRHSWRRHDEGTLYTKGVGFRWCGTCDREEWDNGVVRRQADECVGAETIVMLLPANRTEQGWWQDLVEPKRQRLDFDVEFLRGRMRFDRPNAVIGPKGDRPPFGCCLLIWSSDDV